MAMVATTRQTPTSASHRDSCDLLPRLPRPGMPRFARDFEKIIELPETQSGNLF